MVVMRFACGRRGGHYRPVPTGPQTRVAAVSAQGPSTPAFRIRVLQYERELAARGVALEPLPLFASDEEPAYYDAPLRRRVPTLLWARRRFVGRLEELDAETVLIQRQTDLLSGVALERLAAGKGRLVWDVDDALWHMPAHRLKGMRRRVAWLAQRADCVVAANPLLAAHLETLAGDVRVIPSVVETRGLDVRRHADAEELCVGWIGSFSTAPALRRLHPVLARVARERPVRLLVVGGNVAPVAGLAVECVAWSPETERAALSRMDVGVMPVPDTAWARGKSAYKALQYLAAGVPAVVDDVGVAGDVVEDGES